MSDVQALIKKIQSNPDYVNSLSEAELRETIKKIDVYSNSVVPNTQTGFTCISHTSLRERYIANLKMTAMVGYLYNGLKEYEDFFDIPDACKDDKYYEAMNTRKCIIKGFLDRLFEFNPNLHIRPALYPANDPERSEMPVTIAEENIIELESALTRTTDEALIAQIKNKIAHLKDVIKATRPRTTEEVRLKMYRPQSINNTYVPVPSYELWRNFSRYEEQNYDTLRSIAEKLYGEKSDLESMFIVHKSFNTEEEASKFAKEHAERCMVDISVVQNGYWTLLGAFKENRERIDFYNKNNSLLEAMHNRIIEDQKMANSLLEKQVFRKHLKSLVDSNGEFDSEGLEQYAKNLGNTAGISTALSADSKKYLDEIAEKLRSGELKPSDVYDVDEDGIPHDAIEIPVLTSDGHSITRSRIFSKAHTPDGKEVSPK